MLQKVKQDILNSLYNGDLKILKKIVDYLFERKELEDSIIEKRNILFLSLEYRILPLFSYILNRVENPLKKNDNGDDILTYMIKNNYPEEYFYAFIDNSRRNYNDLDYKVYGMTPLMLALILERHNWSSLLVPYTRNFNIVFDLTPIGYEFIMDYLYDSKILVPELDGMSVLHIATALKQKRIISLLRIEGCPSFIKTRERILPLEIAIKTQSLPVVKELLLFSDLDFVLFYKNKNKQTVFEVLDSLSESYFKKQAFILLKGRLRSFRISTSGRNRRNSSLYRNLMRQ